MLWLGGLIIEKNFPPGQVLRLLARPRLPHSSPSSRKGALLSGASEETRPCFLYFHDLHPEIRRKGLFVINVLSLFTP